MTGSPAKPERDRSNRLEAEGFFDLLVSARKLEWRPVSSGDEIALYDRECDVTIVTDRRAFERLCESRAATRARRSS